MLLNGSAAGPDAVLSDGDSIAVIQPEDAAEEAESPAKGEDGVPITFNGMPAVFPTKPGQQPIFLDILAAFSDDPTTLLANSPNVTINGKLARLDEVIHSGDEIIIE